MTANTRGKQFQLLVATFVMLLCIGCAQHTTRSVRVTYGHDCVDAMSLLNSVSTRYHVTAKEEKDVIVLCTSPAEAYIWTWSRDFPSVWIHKDNRWQYDHGDPID